MNNKTGRYFLLTSTILMLSFLMVSCINVKGKNSASAPSLSETMIEAIPSSYTIPSGGIKFLASGSMATIKHKFVMAQTEVTYELWKKVYDWATDSARGANKYKFANAGTKGGIYAGNWKEGNLAGSAQQPVTVISWRDSIVWCNAYTEWYNANKGGSLSVVYKNGNTILRDATQAVENILGNTFDPTTNTATGFRLPTTTEWGFAASLRKDATNAVPNGTANPTYPINIGGTDYWFTNGNSASGATAEYTNTTETSKVAWYGENSCDDGSGCHFSNSGTKKSKTHDVASKASNALGLYDMTGSVWEWCFGTFPDGRRINLGVSWYDTNASYIPISYVNANGSSEARNYIGFRPVRTVP